MQSVGSETDLVSVESIEQELTLLVRRAQKVHLRGGPTEQVVERAAYGILAWLHDTGPLRSSELAAHFHLDASTISRQVAALEQAGLVTREPDADDRRALRLRLTEHGQRRVDHDAGGTTRRRPGAAAVVVARGSGAASRPCWRAFNAGLDEHLTADPHTAEGGQR